MTQIDPSWGLDFLRRHRERFVELLAEKLKDTQKGLRQHWVSLYDLDDPVDMSMAQSLQIMEDYFELILPETGACAVEAFLELLSESGELPASPN